MPTPLFDKYSKLPSSARSRIEQKFGSLEPASPFDLPEPGFTKYSCTDAVVTHGVENRLMPMVQTMGLSKVSEIDHAIIPMVVDMMSRGMRVDQAHFETFSEALREMMVDQHAEINQWLLNKNITIENIGSDDQVAELLFSTLHLPYLYLTDSGKRPSVDAETLEAIKYSHPIAGMILKWRELETLLTTFALPLLERAKSSPDSRICPNILLTRQPTGRLTTKQPNLLAMPTRTPLGRMIREGFVPTSGYSFLSCDFSQLELRILAHLSKDKHLAEVFNSGVDPFRATAAELWGCKPEDITKANRDITKNNFYGLVYGITAQGLSMRLQGLGLKEWTTSKVQDFMDQFNKLYPGIPIAISGWHAEARSTGMIRDMFGRIRYVPQVRSTKKHVREEGLRQAQNFPMQSGASGIMKLAMKKVWDWNGLGYPDWWVVLQIHDELLSEVQQEGEEIMGRGITDLMESAYGMRVPLKAKFAWSPLSWGAIEK